MSNAYHRVRSKLETYECKYLKISNNVDPLDSIDSDFIYYSCKCGTEMIDQISYVDRTTTPLCLLCEQLEVDKVLHNDKRVYLYGVTRNFCKLYCDVCKCMFKTGKLKAYKKILMNKVVCVQCNKQRSYAV